MEVFQMPLKLTRCMKKSPRFENRHSPWDLTNLKTSSCKAMINKVVLCFRCYEVRKSINESTKVNINTPNEYEIHDLPSLASISEPPTPVFVVNQEPGIKDFTV